jgi:Lysyl oxidase
MASTRGRLRAASLLAFALPLILGCTSDSPPDSTPIPPTAAVTPALVLGVDAVPTTTVVATTPEPGSDHGLLLPDIAVSPPRELYVAFAGDGRQLRFSTTVSNVGAGPLEIVGLFDEDEERAFATQLLHRAEDDPFQHPVGTLDFDGGHGHWHFQDFMTFELWTYTESGALNEMLASTGKISFCLLDFTAIDPPLEHAYDLPLFDVCDWTRQGLSPGWEETYAAWLPGQELDITDVPDGRYVVRTVLDPDNRLIDANRFNHTVAVFIELTEYGIQVLEPASEQ